MSIIEQIFVESRRYSGWADPRYPIGYWQAALAVTGDATGGLMGVDLVFQGAAPPALNSQMYSVERIGVSINSGVVRAFTLQGVNMAGPANQGFINRYIVTSASRTGGGIAALPAEVLDFMPWFLGSQRLPGITASLSLVGQNDNAVVVTFEAEGYRWGARSVLVDGGPQRPPTGLYRA